MELEEQEAIQMLVDNKKIFLFNDELFKQKYNDYIFLFTGSKEMRPIINKLIDHLER